MNPVLLWSLVVVCGGAGALLRVLVADAVGDRGRPEAFPLGILVVNLSGALALGLLDGLVLPHDAALVVGAAFVGAYTTFSTWMVDADQLAKRGRSRLGALDLVLSLAGGLALAALGLWLGGLLR